MSGSRRALVGFVVTALLVTGAALGAGARTRSGSTADSTNAPWYPSLQAFEHYNSARSHVFSQAKFGAPSTGRTP